MIVRVIEQVKEDQTCLNWYCKALRKDIEKRACRERGSKGVDMGVYRKEKSLGSISVGNF